MKIALASDHAGYELKKAVADDLAARRIDHIDLGCGPGEKVDYVDFAAKAARAMASGECDRAVLVCGTGIGMAVAANKFKGVRATPAWNDFSAEMTRLHNDSNCLTLGGRVLTAEEGLRFLGIWLETPFEGGRHAARIDKIREIERQNFK
jgi:ribose 5-phosphate isomerase B